MAKYMIIAFGFLCITFLACDKSQVAITPSSEQQETDILQTISQETSSALAYSMGELTNTFRSSSMEELEAFDVKQFSNKSILDYSSQSAFLSPHVETVQAVLNSRDFEMMVRSSQNISLSEIEQKFVEEITEAFSLLPDVEAFKQEIAGINTRIQSEVEDEVVRVKLLVVSASSEASGVYFAENKQNILNDILESIDTTESGFRYANFRRTDDKSVHCCFQGEYQGSWTGFGTAVVAGATGMATTTWILNMFPGSGQIGYGAAVLAGAAGGGAAYLTSTTIDWLLSPPSESSLNKQ